jgi:hypothetical protein
LINSTTTLSQTDIIVAFMGSGFSLFYNPYAMMVRIALAIF